MKILFGSIQALLDCLSHNTNIQGCVFESKYWFLLVLLNKVKIMSLVNFVLKVKTTSYYPDYTEIYRRSNQKPLVDGQTIQYTAEKRIKRQTIVYKTLHIKHEPNQSLCECSCSERKAVPVALLAPFWVTHNKYPVIIHGQGKKSYVLDSGPLICYAKKKNNANR